MSVILCFGAFMQVQAQSTRPVRPSANGLVRVLMAETEDGAASVPHPRLERGVFVIAKRGLNDPNFNRSVILITQYDDAGTVGLVINRTLQMPAEQLLPPIAQLGLDPGEIHVGGPVAVNSLQLLIRSAAVLEESLHVFADVYLINESATLNELLDGRISGSAVRLYAGYTGWGPGQLESELLRGDWYLWPADSSEIFSASPDTVWPRLILQAAAQWALGLPAGPDCGARPWSQYNDRLLHPPPDGGHYGPGQRPGACPTGGRPELRSGDPVQC